MTRLGREECCHPGPVSFLRRYTAHDPRADGITLTTFIGLGAPCGLSVVVLEVSETVELLATTFDGADCLNGFNCRIKSSFWSGQQTSRPEDVEHK